MTTYTEEDPDDDGTNVQDYDMQDWSYSNQPSSYDQVHLPESLWQLYYMEADENELETVDELQHLGEFGMKPAYQFATHKEDPLAPCYNKIDPIVLVTPSDSVEVHRFTGQRHAHVVSKTTACIYNLREVVEMDSWRKTPPFPFASMRAAPDMSFDKSGTPGSATSYQWYTKIELVCHNVRSALLNYWICEEERDWEFRNKLKEENLPNQIRRLHRMHRELCGIDDLIHIADRIDLFFEYRHFRTVGKMRPRGPSAISILGLILDLTRVCQKDDWLLQDRASFLGHKTELLLQWHHLQDHRGTVPLGYKRYGLGPVRTQDLMAQLQKYHRSGQSTGPDPYNVVSPGAPMNLVQLSTTYQISNGRVSYHNFEREIPKVAHLPPTDERYMSLFPFQDCADLTQRLGTSKYLMSPWESGYEDHANYWRQQVFPTRRCVCRRTRGAQIQRCGHEQNVSAGSSRPQVVAARFELLSRSLPCANLQVPLAD